MLFTVLAVILPFAANMMRLLNTYVHDLMTYAIWILYLVPILLWKWTFAKHRVAQKTYISIVMLLSFIIFSDIQTANTVYVKKQVESRATLTFMTEILTQVNLVQGYIPGETPVIFVGQVSEIIQEVPGTKRITGITGCNKSSAITYKGTYQAYFENVMLRDVRVLFSETIKDKPEIKVMPAYPQIGYVKLVDGSVIVKLKESDEE